MDLNNSEKHNQQDARATTGIFCAAHISLKCVFRKSTLYYTNITNSSPIWKFQFQSKKMNFGQKKRIQEMYPFQCILQQIF